MSTAPDRTLDLDLPATVDGLQTGLLELERHCTVINAPAGAVSRILTMFEEIFTNTVKYGYCGRDGARIRARLAGGDRLRLTLEDSAPPFDPTAWDPTADLAGDVSARPVGRLGIALVMGLALRVRWEALAPGNRLTLEVSTGEGSR